MSKISLDRITSQFGFQAALNSILQRLEEEFTNKVLYRNNPAGEANTMQNDLDMGDKSILNCDLISAKDFRVDGVDITTSLEQAIAEVAAYPAEAKGFRDEAEGWAIAAEASSVNSANSASQASISEANAAASASQASVSALASETSATEAQTVVDGAVDSIREEILTEMRDSLIPVGMEFMWFADPTDPLGNVPAGYVLAFGEELSRATYPDLWEFVVGTGRMVPETTWQSAYAANGGNVGFYSDGNGTTTFRVPCIMRYVSGGEISEAGTYLGDAIRNITGVVGGVDGRRTPSGALTMAEILISNSNITSSGGNSLVRADFNASLQVPTASENRPKTIKRTCIIKAFSATVNTGTVDVTSLASDVATIASTQQTIKKQKLGIDNYLWVRDEKPSGTAGGTSSSNTWHTRDVNTIKVNNIVGAGLSSNRLTLPAGTYYVRASCPAYLSSSSKCKLYNFTDSVDILAGPNEYSFTTSTVQVRCTMSGVFTLATQKTVELRQWVATGFASSGLGVNASQGTEVYTEVEVWKVS